MPSQSEITKPSKPDATLEHVGDQLVGVHLDRIADAVLVPVHAGERGHHTADVVAADGGEVRRQIDRLEVLPGGDRDALVDRVPLLLPRPALILGRRRIVLRVAVAGIVLDGRQHVIGSMPYRPWPCRPSMIVSIWMTSAGSSPKLS